MLTWPELVAKALDGSTKVLVKDPRFVHLCPGSGCAVCRFLERPQ